MRLVFKSAIVVVGLSAGFTLASSLVASREPAVGSPAQASTLPPLSRPGARFHAPPKELFPAIETLLQQPPEVFHEFYFTRAIYSSGGGSRFGYGRRGRGGRWATDYPKADRQFIVVVKRLANLDAYDWENAISLSDPNVRRFPFLYALEVGSMRLTDREIQGLRDYLAAGGFLIIDDFWGPYQWANFEYEMTRALPEYPIVDLPMSHSLFSTFYNIEEIKQVPNIGNGSTGNPRYYSESGGDAVVKAMFDEKGRLMVVINFDTDLGDAWEWAENPYYPLDRSTFAYEMGVNLIIYAMSH